MLRSACARAARCGALPAAGHTSHSKATKVLQPAWVLQLSPPLHAALRPTLVLQGFGSVKVLPAVGRNATAPLRRLRSAAAAVACGCEEAALLEGSDDEDSLEPLSEGDGAAAADQEEGDEEEQGDDSLGGACAYAAWLLPLHAGQNCFNITLPEVGCLPYGEAAWEAVGVVCRACPGLDAVGGVMRACMWAAGRSHPGDPAAPMPLQGNDTSSNDVALGEREQYTLTVVQLAEPENAELESITGAEGCCFCCWQATVAALHNSGQAPWQPCHNIPCNCGWLCAAIPHISHLSLLYLPLSS